MVSECALLLALTPREELPMDTHGSRVLTAVSAFGGALEEKMRASGFFDIETEIMD